MVDWMSPETILSNADSFSKFMHVLLGVYIWEWATSINFDLKVVRGIIPFAPALIAYFLNRYCLLFALIGIAFALNVKTEVNCQALYTFNQVLGNASIGLASINLCVRAVAIWSRDNYYVWGGLTVLALGQWGLLVNGLLLKAAWVPGQGCVITETNNKVLAASFIYTMSFDFIVLALVVVKLAFLNGASRSGLVSILLKDGITYFVIAFLVNLLATIFMLLNLNPVMSIIANVPAAIASTIVATRAVRTLKTWTETQRVEKSSANPVMLTTKHGETSEPLNFRKNNIELNSFPSREPKYGYDGGGVRIQRSQEYDPESNEDLKAPSLHAQ